MITIGIGNRKGGVGSTTLTFQLAALLQRAGLTVTIAETSSGLADLHWCTCRATRAKQVLNCSKGAINHLHLDDCSWRLREYELGTDFALLDYSNGGDIVAAMSHVQHWICPFGPLEADPTLETYRLWQSLHPDPRATRQAFCAVLSLAPGGKDIAREPDLADPRWNGEASIDELAQRAPGLYVLSQRIRWTAVMADTLDGWDVFSAIGPGAVAACTEIESVWGEVLALLKRGGMPPDSGPSARSSRRPPEAWRKNGTPTSAPRL